MTILPTPKAADSIRKNQPLFAIGADFSGLKMLVLAKADVRLSILSSPIATDMGFVEIGPIAKLCTSHIAVASFAKASL